MNNRLKRNITDEDPDLKYKISVCMIVVNYHLLSWSLSNIILDFLCFSNMAHEIPRFQGSHISNSQHNMYCILFFFYSQLSISKSSKIKVCLTYSYVCYISHQWHKAL